MKKFICYIIFILLSQTISVTAQQVQITDIQMKGEKIEVYYNLIDERINRTYSIYLYTSKDNFISPVNQVSGDVGIDIAVGNNKKIVWEAKKELGADFDGSISIELKGNYYIPFITLDGISKNQELVRGKSQDLVWTGGRGDNILNFQLYRGDELVKSFEERPNNGNTSIAIPGRVKPGDNYRLRISDKRNRDDVVFTDTFIIKRQIPLSLQIAGSAIATVGVGVLIYLLQPEPPIGDPPIPNR